MPKKKTDFEQAHLLSDRIVAALQKTCREIDKDVIALSEVVGPAQSLMDDGTISSIPSNWYVLRDILAIAEGLKKQVSVERHLITPTTLGKKR